MVDIFDLELEVCVAGSYYTQREPITYQAYQSCIDSARKYLLNLSTYSGERVYILKNGRKIGHMNKPNTRTKVLIYE